MTEIITAARFDADYNLPDWRYLLGRIEATFRAPSFPAATALAVAIADDAEAADHHPDIDIRYPGVVHVVLVTHAANGLTTLDTDLAAVISDRATSAGATAEPTRNTSREIAIDALDIAVVMPFWQAVLGYVRVPADDPDAVDLADPLRLGPGVWFQQMDEARPERNNVHIDVSVSHDIAEQRVADALAAGGRMVSDASAKSFWVLADPEGNEACVCTWQDRD